MAQKPFPKIGGNSGTDKPQWFRIQIKGERKREAQKVHTSQNFNFSLILANIEN